MPKSTDLRSGQATLMVTLSLTLILGMLGLAVDLGWAYYRQQAAQAAADAAVAAAVRAAVNTAPSGPSCGNAAIFCGAATNCPATAPGTASTNFDNACMLASANGFTTSGIDTVSVQAGTTSPVPTVSGLTPAYWVIVRVKESLPALFGAAFARGGFTPGAIATAAASGSAASGTCVYVLDPSGNDAFEAANGASVNLGCGVYVDSNNATAAMYVTGGASVTSTFIKVAGAFKEDNGGTTSVTPTTGAASVADPFAGLPSPTPAPSCQSGDFTAWQATPYTPTPGTYCGFSLANGMSLQMSPGTYIVDGGTFSIQGGATVTSSGGVMIYLTNGATVNIANGASVTLSAQASGTYQGVLFYQDRSMLSPGASTFAGGATMNLTGSLYLPHATLDINNGAAVGNTMAIVADMVNFQGGAHILADAGGTKTGLSAGYTVSMIQ
ncbi:MAG TPA: pilus assembly protein TadG-related protein [Bryobacteraceae bacterium]|nr:pilus assembly protein TadG-related protein [Bryobacteraceae bacterium]